MKELLDRYNLSSRQTIYNWAEAADFTLEKGSRNRIEATEEQVALLDSVQNHLRRGNSLESFIPPSQVSIVQSEGNKTDSKVDSKTDNESKDVYSGIDTQVDKLDLLTFLTNLAHLQVQEKDLLEPERQLQELADNGWTIETTRLEKILGVEVRVRGNKTSFQRGCWVFEKVGKIGKQTAWSVSKIDNFT